MFCFRLVINWTGGCLRQALPFSQSELTKEWALFITECNDNPRSNRVEEPPPAWRDTVTLALKSTFKLLVMNLCHNSCVIKKFFNGCPRQKIQVQSAFPLKSMTIKNIVTDNHYWGGSSISQWESTPNGRCQPIIGYMACQLIIFVFKRQW